MQATDKIKAIYNILSGNAVPVNKIEPLAAYENIFSVSYNGEKNLGEIGPIKDYRPDYDALRFRSWQAYLDSELSQTVIKRFKTWIIGSGLKLQAEPAKRVLETESISIDSEKFNDTVESRFGVYSNSPMADYANMQSLHMLAEDAFVNSIVGGDVLVVLRLVNGSVKVQLIDGSHIGQPLINNEFVVNAKEKGNRVRHGIEIAPNGEHVAYFINKGNHQYERIEARQKDTDLLMAFMVYGMKYRLDSVRGLPLVVTVLETLKKLERYKEATVGSAEERQKIAYTIEHGIASTGENPLSKNIAKAFNYSEAGQNEIPIDVQHKQLADTVAVSTNKQVFNMPNDSKLVTHESKNELYFKDFYTVNIDLICSTLGIPPEVAMSKYNSNFSASRAALKDWEHTINVTRKNFAFQFYQKIYAFWLEVEILKNKVQAHGYLLAKNANNLLVVNAYQTCRFIGSAVPHIDPLKEVKAEREKLGLLAGAIPLTTVEAATEALNGGDSDQNMEQFSDELEMAVSLGIGMPEKDSKLPDSSD